MFRVKPTELVNAFREASKKELEAWPSGKITVSSLLCFDERDSIEQFLNPCSLASAKADRLSWCFQSLGSGDNVG